MAKGALGFMRKGINHGGSAEPQSTDVTSVQSRPQHLACNVLRKVKKKVCRSLQVRAEPGGAFPRSGPVWWEAEGPSLFIPTPETSPFPPTEETQLIIISP